MSRRPPESQNPRSERENRGTSASWALSEEAAERLREFASLVGRWAPKLNLVGPRELAAFEERHIADSLRPLPLFADLIEGPCIDVGSGAGLPGVPLAVAVPERHWRLLEPRRKRAAFLDIVVRELGLNAEVIVATAAQAAADPRLRGVHAAALARGLAAPTAALEMIAPLVRTGGLAIAFVGERAAVPEVADGSRAGLAIVRSDVARDRAPEA